MIENSGKNQVSYDLRRERIILPCRKRFPSEPTC